MGRPVRHGWPWIHHEDDAWWVAWDEITDDATAALSGGERRALAMLKGLATGPMSDLAGGLDHDTTLILLAALEHAAGGGTPTTIVTGTRFETVVRPQHYPWPGSM